MQFLTQEPMNIGLTGLGWLAILSFGASEEKMSGDKQQLWTVVVFLLIASALINACGTS